MASLSQWFPTLGVRQNDLGRFRQTSCIVRGLGSRCEAFQKFPSEAQDGNHCYAQIQVRTVVLTPSCTVGSPGIFKNYGSWACARASDLTGLERGLGIRIFRKPHVQPQLKITRLEVLQVLGRAAKSLGHPRSCANSYVLVCFSGARVPSCPQFSKLRSEPKTH